MNKQEKREKCSVVKRCTSGKTNRMDHVTFTGPVKLYDAIQGC